MIVSECFVSSLVTIYRRRALPVPGVVSSRFGEQLSSERIVAEADVPQGYHLLDLEDELGIRVRDAAKLLVSEIGTVVQEGDVVARRRGLLKKECVSPVQGKILDARRGKVLIEAMPVHLELKALYPGKVVNVIPERGVVIEATGALIQGVWGFGQELRGRMECLVSQADDALEPDQVSAGHMGTILVGGRGVTEETIERAVENRVAGLILGSVTSDLLPAIQASGLSVVVTEGFGDFAMNSKAFDLLHTWSGQDACLNPTLQARHQVQRPEILVPQPVESPPTTAEVGAELAIGTPVRALRAPYENKVGEVVSLPPRAYRLESGVRTRGAEVDLESVGKVFIPFENLEILRQA
jgi:hypothetical protein